MVNAQHPKLVNVELEVGAVKGLCEDVGEMIVGADGKEMEEVALELFMNHMIVNVNVFHSLIEGRILSIVSS